MKSQVVSLSEWRKARPEPCPIRDTHNSVKRPRRSANLVKWNVVPAVGGRRRMALSTRTTLLVGLLVLTAGLWLWMVFKLDAIVAMRVAKLWHLDIP